MELVLPLAAGIRPEVYSRQSKVRQNRLAFSLRSLEEPGNSSLRVPLQRSYVSGVTRVEICIAVFHVLANKISMKEPETV